jgi:3-dehydroquinate synthase
MKKIPLAIQPSLKKVEITLCSLFESLDSLKRLGSRFALFCDEKVAEALGKRWHAHLQEGGLNVTLFSFPSGEKEKSRERKAALEDQLLAEKFGKDSCFIALGGGATTDLIGFLASTYCRGVRLVFAPTTLLAMVDAAIGGKTAVNTPFGKNLIGTFYPADQLLIDPTVLSSLPQSELTNGVAEVIKYALISSPPLFQALRTWKNADPAYLEMIIHECIMTKGRIVEFDFEEKKGERRILNFGHTIAHALEQAENYQLPHGEAVAMGMLVESFISVRMGHLSEQILSEITELVRSFPFSLKITSKVTDQKIRNALALDKKNKNGEIRSVLLEKIGSCCSFQGEYCCVIPEKTLGEAIKWMFEMFQ